MKLAINDSYFISDIAQGDQPAYIEHLRVRQIYEQTLTIPFPYTQADADWWVDHSLAAYAAAGGRSSNWAIRRASDDYLVGGIGFVDLKIGQTHKAELGYFLCKPLWNTGLMTQTVARVCEYGFREFGLEKITAHVFAHNVGSARVLEKNGFQCEGLLRGHYKKDGRIFDGKIYGRLVTDPVGVPDAGRTKPFKP